MPRPGNQTPRIDLRLLTYLHTVATTGNITRAAQILNIAQPTLSKALQILETQVGDALLVRHAHGVTLTPIGERLNQHAIAIRAQVSQAESEIEERRTGAAGTVRIGAGPSWVRRFLPQVVAELLEERPRIRIEVDGGFDSNLLAGLRAGRLDFVIAELPLERGGDYRFEFLTKDDLVPVARPEHPLAGRKNVDASEALAAAWALPPDNTLARRKLDGRVTSLGHMPPRPLITSSSQAFLMLTARMMDLLLYTTRKQLTSAEGLALVEIDVPALVTSREAGLIYRSGALLTPAAELVADRLTTRCAADPIN